MTEYKAYVDGLILWMRYILQYVTVPEILNISLLVLMSLLIRLVLQLSSQQWVTTVAHTATLVFIPIITYIITKVISGNIALSLGMVGALSIVRFRNPVRSPLELSTYFFAITMGIAASVDIRWLVFLAVSATLASIFLLSAKFISSAIFKRKLFETSFNEGNSLSTLHISIESAPKHLENNKLLISKTYDEGGFVYVFASHKIEELNLLLAAIEKEVAVTSFQLKR